ARQRAGADPVGEPGAAGDVRGPANPAHRDRSGGPGERGGRRLGRPAPGPDDRLPQAAPDGPWCVARPPGRAGVVLVPGAALESGERREGSTVNHRVSTDDQAFRTEFEAGKFPPGAFNHRAHIRLAYVSLAEYDTEAAHRLMQQALLNFLRHNGIDVS